MATLESVVVPKNSGGAFVVKKGQRIRIAGRSIVDFERRGSGLAVEHVIVISPGSRLAF